MPSYLYRCNQCGHQFEERLSAEVRDSVSICPSCGGSQVRRLLSVFFVASKGSQPTASSASGCGCGGGCSCGGRAN